MNSAASSPSAPILPLATAQPRPLEAIDAHVAISFSPRYASQEVSGILVPGAARTQLGDDAVEPAGTDIGVKEHPVFAVAIGLRGIDLAIRLRGLDVGIRRIDVGL